MHHSCKRPSMFFRKCDGTQEEGALACDVGIDAHGGENSWFFRSGYNNPGECRGQREYHVPVLMCVCVNHKIIIKSIHSSRQVDYLPPLQHTRQNAAAKTLPRPMLQVTGLRTHHTWACQSTPVLAPPLPPSFGSRRNVPPVMVLTIESTWELTRVRLHLFPPLRRGFVQSSLS
jgi:hypothetical protein